MPNPIPDEEPMKYRIVKSDPYNWRLERWSEGGKHPLTGKPGRPGWRGMESYHPNLRAAARALLDHAAGDALLASEATSVLDALNKAEERVEAAVVEKAVRIADRPSRERRKGQGMVTP